MFSGRLKKKRSYIWWIDLTLNPLGSKPFQKHAKNVDSTIIKSQSKRAVVLGLK